MSRKILKKVTRVDYVELTPGRPDICGDGVFEYYCSDCKYFFICYPEALATLDLGDDNVRKLFQHVERLIKDKK